MQIYKRIAFFLPRATRTRHGGYLSESLACPHLFRCDRQWWAGAGAELASPVQVLRLPASCGKSLQRVLYSVQVSILSGADYDALVLTCAAAKLHGVMTNCFLSRCRMSTI